jgi:hypothetical protein
MKLLEKLLYSLILFVFTYVVISMGLRMFDITEIYESHMIGGIAATILSMLLFMFLLIRKKENETF